MLVIVGLGNPGEKFEKTRHNVGFMAVDFFAVENNFPDFKMEKKYNALLSQNEEIILAKPQTFMNESGCSVKKVLNHSPWLNSSKGLISQGEIIQLGKSKILNLIVIHDDIDLPLGKLKISKNSGAGGHKGVESIINNLGTNNFIRFKIGICPEKGKPKSVESFVIKKFTKEELIVIEETIKKTSDALDLLIKEGSEKAMNRYN